MTRRASHAHRRGNRSLVVGALRVAAEGAVFLGFVVVLFVWLWLVTP